MSDIPVRVRFAPSPTGFLHVGGARTALFNWLFARHHKGTFILRIEDTDLQRSTEEATHQILDSLQWLGITWDEGPYSQRERADRHREVADRLVAEGKAYRDFTSEEEIEAERQTALAHKKSYVYRGKDRDLSPAESKSRAGAAEPFCVRFRVPEDEPIVVHDNLAGDVTFEGEHLSDFVLLRPDGNPVYNFACAIDDVDMRITHVIRGSDHLSNTPRQLLVIRALGAQDPQYTHVPLIMKDGKKMSKRDADADPHFPVSVHARREMGYLPEATVNFLALLGWNYDPENELFTLGQAVERFDGTGLNASAANFDEAKYTWMNAWYIRNLPRKVVLPLAVEFMRHAGLTVEDRDPAWLEGIIELAVERSEYLRDFATNLEFFFRPPAEYEPKAIKKIFGKPGVAQRLRTVAQRIQETVPFTLEGLEDQLRRLCEETGEKFGNLAQPARLALTGRTASPGIFEIMFYLGREECASRLLTAAGGIESGQISFESTP